MQEPPAKSGSHLLEPRIRKGFFSRAKDGYRQRTTVNLNPTTWMMLDTLCDAWSVNRSELLRRLLEPFVKTVRKAAHDHRKDLSSLSFSLNHEFRPPSED